MVEELRRNAASTKRLADLPLLDFIGDVEGLDAPNHLAELVHLFERVDRGETVKAVVSTPPQHGKSLTCFLALTWLLMRNPRLRNAYATYAQAFTRDQSAIAHTMSDTRGLALSRATLDRWRTYLGGGVVWTSRGGPLTGHPVDGVIVLDDLIKDWEEASSLLIRNKAMAWLSSVAMTRMHPGASIIVVATRWHLDDPSGRLLKQQGWEHVKLPAISGSGEALWPERRPLDWLMEQKSNLLPSHWSALYMAEPVQADAFVFGPSTYYDTLPDSPYREAHGFDAAYTEASSADYSVTLTGRKVGDKLYLTNMLRAQSEPGDFIPLMQAHGVRKVTWYGSSTEKGLVGFLQREGIRVKFISATQDKLVRAIPAATAWNRGDILLPHHASWAPAVEAELSQFTGRNDPHDDVVDALAALHHELMGGPKPMTEETRRTISPW